MGKGREIRRSKTLKDASIECGLDQRPRCEEGRAGQYPAEGAIAASRSALAHINKIKHCRRVATRYD